MASTTLNPQTPSGKAGSMVSAPGTKRGPCIPCSKKGR